MKARTSNDPMNRGEGGGYVPLFLLHTRLLLSFIVSQLKDFATRPQLIASSKIRERGRERESRAKQKLTRILEEVLSDRLGDKGRPGRVHRGRSLVLAIPPL